MFKFLQKRHGKEAVVKYWEELSDKYGHKLRNIAIEKGLAGCFEQWSHSLTEEAADFRMTLDVEKGIFTITMRDCPSKGLLLREEHIEPYEDYCEHCDIIYRRVLKPLGYEYNIDLSESDQTRCKLIVRRKS